MEPKEFIKREQRKLTKWAEGPVSLQLIKELIEDHIKKSTALRLFCSFKGMTIQDQLDMVKACKELIEEEQSQATRGPSPEIISEKKWGKVPTFAELYPKKD